MSGHRSIPVDSNEITPNLARHFGVEGDWHFAIRRECFWADLDGFGHMNNLAFLEWCQEVRTRYFRMMVGSWPTPGEPGPVIKALDFSYHRPLGLGDQALVTARVEKMGVTSYTQRYAIWNDGLIGEGSAVCVLMIGTTGQKTPISEQLRARIASFEGVA